jgi:hypothetical protein
MSSDVARADKTAVGTPKLLLPLLCRRGTKASATFAMCAPVGRGMASRKLSWFR